MSVLAFLVVPEPKRDLGLRKLLLEDQRILFHSRRDPTRRAKLVAANEKSMDNALTSPVLSALVELRQDVERLFDEYRFQFAGRDADTGAVADETIATGAAISQSSTSLRPVAMQTIAPIEAAPLSFRKPVARVNEMPPIHPEPPDSHPHDSAGGARAEDSRQRLDALAKLLDKRLKPSNGGSTGSP